MNHDPQPESVTVTFTYDSDNRLTAIHDPESDPSKVSDLPREPLFYRPRTALFDFEHDAQKGIFRLKWPDGTNEVFRDKPARYLVVEPDPETGEIKPVVKRGCPTYLYLCREEREVR